MARPHCAGGHGQGIGDELLAHVLGHRVAQQPSGVEVEHRGQVEPALAGGDVMSPTQATSGHSDRSIGPSNPAKVATPLARMVVRTLAGLYTPTMPWARISRSTCLWLVGRPRRASSVVMRGLP